MLCPSCNAFRPTNNAPCPQCNAPSPLVTGAGGQYQVPPPVYPWGGPITPTSNNGWSNQLPQGSFKGGINDNTLWGQVMAPQASPGPVQQQNSLLPIPYQVGMVAPQPELKVTSPNLPAIHTGNGTGSMMPAIPGEEGMIHIPPMYTKPRAIIPPYRAISGLISVIIVFAMLCTGAGFYAKATGKLTLLQQLYGNARPDTIKTTQPTTLAVPQTAPLFGPASQIINSATTALKIDSVTAQPQVPTNQFKVGDTIFLTYSAHPKSPGIVIAKWYTNNHFYQQSTSTIVKEASSGYFPMQYLQSVQGKVELYWNDQLAVTLLFVVEPARL